VGSQQDDSIGDDMKKNDSMRRRLGTLLIAALAAGSAGAQQTPWRPPPQPGPGNLAPNAYDNAVVPVAVALNKSQVLEFQRPITRVSVGNPEIADILVVRARQIYIIGKQTGTTNVVLWGEDDGVIGILNVEVTRDLEALKAKLYEVMPQERIQVRSSHGSVVLSGEVSSAVQADAALRIAATFAGTTEGGTPAVLNLLQVGGAQQVMLDVKVAEVSRTLTRRLNIQFSAFDSGAEWKIGAVNGGARFPDAIFKDPLLGDVRAPVFSDGTPNGPMVEEFAPTTPSITDAGLFASYLSGEFLFNAVIDAAKSEGLARILAEPNLTTLTGQEARFLAGGEFPIPVPQDNNITIEFKEFGIGLEFLPVVLSSGIINLKVNVTVSELVTDNSVTVSTSGETSQQFFIPALVKRSATSTVELASGNTIAIAGMINESLRENIDKFPGLGDLPIIGLLFRSQEFVKEQTELVIFVTPRLARPIDPELAQLPTDDFVEPSDLEFYLLGRLSDRRPAREAASASLPVGHIEDIDTRQLPSRQSGGTKGRFGHGLPDTVTGG
jgi:pilus assembly protein CpaC